LKMLQGGLADQMKKSGGGVTVDTLALLLAIARASKGNALLSCYFPSMVELWAGEVPGMAAAMDRAEMLCPGVIERLLKLGDELSKQSLKITVNFD